ncbi:hypothetical protein KFK09_005124 [Dendrobium nobile]|uniref:Uncharacterized protein n=1 Tax=Dendrobium nobile TaxID=94219 RepID=A0A8T3C008_DENNO|nr:hypothetical protein KFK09_005124 [Dendrobium nobile]
MDNVPDLLSDKSTEHVFERESCYHGLNGDEFNGVAAAKWLPPGSMSGLAEKHRSRSLQFIESKACSFYLFICSLFDSLSSLIFLSLTLSIHRFETN